jgi:hypothetical protein
MKIVKIIMKKNKKEGNGPSEIIATYLKVPKCCSGQGKCLNH